MSAIVKAFIAGRHQRMLRGALWGAIFAALLAMGYGFIVWQVTDQLARDQRGELSRISAIGSKAVTALQMLQRDATAAPCSRDFLVQMRRVAFLPDGLNEFLYAPGGRVECSTSQPKFAEPILLSVPDIGAARSDDPSWRIDRDLGLIGLQGTIGTIAQLGAFAVAIPPYTGYEDEASWLQKELIALGAQGKVWPVAGDRGLYQKVADGPKNTYLSGLTTVTRCVRHGKPLLRRLARRSSRLGARLDHHPVVDRRTRRTFRLGLRQQHPRLAGTLLVIRIPVRLRPQLRIGRRRLSADRRCDLRRGGRGRGAGALAGCRRDGRTPAPLHRHRSAFRAHRGVHANGRRPRLCRAKPATAGRRAARSQF